MGFHQLALPLDYHGKYYALAAITLLLLLLLRYYNYNIILNISTIILFLE